MEHFQRFFALSRSSRSASRSSDPATVTQARERTSDLPLCDGMLQTQVPSSLPPAASRRAPTAPPRPRPPPSAGLDPTIVLLPSKCVIGLWNRSVAATPPAARRPPPTAGDACTSPTTLLVEIPPVQMMSSISTICHQINSLLHAASVSRPPVRRNVLRRRHLKQPLRVLPRRRV
jgi:hypothetical protein